MTQATTPLPAPRTVLVGDLFSGIGGFSLAAHWMGWRTAWFSEIDPFACRVLAHHWPDVPNLGDITRIDWTTVAPVDVVTGGFPCQDISPAGRGAGITGARSGLWGEIVRAVGVLRPRYVVVENSAMLLTRGLDVVLGDLCALGYDAEWSVISACAVGAAHVRERVYILAHADAQYGAPGVRRAAPQAQRALRPARSGARAGARPPAWVEDPSAFYGGADGVPDRVDRNAALGNSIVPQCAVEIFRTIDAMTAERAA